MARDVPNAIANTGPIVKLQDCAVADANSTAVAMLSLLPLPFSRCSGVSMCGSCEEAGIKSGSLGMVLETVEWFRRLGEASAVFWIGIMIVGITSLRPKERSGVLAQIVFTVLEV